MAKPGLRGDRFIFIGGNPRSGTTLLQNILDSHPQVYGGPEFDPSPLVAMLRKELRSALAKGRIEAFCSYEDIDDAIASLYERLLLPAADRAECRYLSDKHPDNLMIFADLLEVFPGARFLHIVRDPRAVIASLLQVGRKAGGMGVRLQGWYVDFESAIVSVQDVVRHGFAAAAAAPDRVHTVRYEDLVTHAEQETKAICKFLGLKWSSDLVHPAKKKHPGEQALLADARNQAWYDLDTYYKDPEPSAIEKFRGALSPGEIHRVNAAFSQIGEYAALGYELNPP